MERILMIETSTALCSVALSENGKIISYKESTEPKAHASKTAVFIEEALREHNITAGECDAVCVSKGPGSYTGLRVGVSTAKGICFGTGIPLLGADTLEILVWQAISESLLPENCSFIVPMIDARRMEVYSSVFSAEGNRLTETKPYIVEKDSFSEYLEKGTVLFIGDGAGKCTDIIGHQNARFLNCCPKASSMLVPAEREYKKKRFQDVAYFEPFYLKDFVATVSRKKLF